MSVALLVLVAVAPSAWAQRRWGVEVGHSYSSTRAIRQPATFTVAIADTVSTEIDAGVLVGGPLGSSASLELGVRALAGSGRTSARRVYGAMARGYASVGQWVGALSAEYEADGSFDVQKGVAGVELTPIGWTGACLGVRCARPRFAWRPWLGVGVGNTFRASSGLAAPEEGTFARAYLRTELSWLPRRGVELNAESAAWYLARRGAGRTNSTASLAASLGKGFSLAAKGQVGCPPPRFEYSRSLTVGLGYVLRREVRE